MILEDEVSLQENVDDMGDVKWYPGYAVRVNFAVNQSK